MCIGWTSNAPWANTGYGMQTAQAITRLKRDGHEVAVFNNYGLEGAKQDYRTKAGAIPVYPRGGDLYSNDSTPFQMAEWKYRHSNLPSVLITLYDVWVYKGKGWDDHNIASWVPIDHMPAPPQVLAWLRKPNVTPLAMSQYGKALIESAGIESLYIPHGIDSVFKPTSHFRTEAGESLTGRELMGVGDDRFVVGMNAANKGVSPVRKAFGENLLAFSMFAKKHSDALLYLYTDAIGSQGGINLLQLVKAVGIPPEQVRFVDPYTHRQGLPQEGLAALYTAMDVLLAVSYGEGFGVPTVEAQACGTRVIVSDFAASTELCGDGWLVDGQPLWDAPQGAFFHSPNVAEIVVGLESAYEAGQSRSAKAQEFASGYLADVVFDKYWRPAIKVLSQMALESA